MQYRAFKDKQLSALGYGAMRFPTIGEGENQRIDEEASARIVTKAYRSGINYFDTAYNYHNETSEIVLGRILSAFPRESFYLADKYPGHIVPTSSDPHEIFEEQLRRCGVDYFDFYLLHNVNDQSIHIYMDETLGIVDYLLKEKAKGRIRHFGFSCHARPEELERFLKRYGQFMEFGQLQLNYLDWTLQDAKAKYELLGAYGIPVWVMEPTRGGALTSFSEEDEAKLKALRPEVSIASWAFRWLQSLPDVTVVLSGMTTEEALVDNLKTFQTHRPLNDSEQALLQEIAVGLVDRVPCTSCRYCTSECPMHLEIPSLLNHYNDFCFKPGAFTRFSALKLDDKTGPAACIACGACVRMCPQGIQIPEVFADFTARIEDARAGR